MKFYLKISPNSSDIKQHRETVWLLMFVYLRAWLSHSFYQIYLCVLFYLIFIIYNPEYNRFCRVKNLCSRLLLCASISLILRQMIESKATDCFHARLPSTSLKLLLFVNLNPYSKQLNVLIFSKHSKYFFQDLHSKLTIEPMSMEHTLCIVILHFIKIHRYTSFQRHMVKQSEWFVFAFFWS